MRQPEQGELQLVILVDDRPPVAIWIRAEALDERLAAVEAAREFDENSRRDRDLQMGGRIYAYDQLRAPNAPQALQDFLGLEVLWLAINHFAAPGEVRAGINAALQRDGFAVLTLIIASAPGEPAGTHWAVSVGRETYETRAQWADQAPTETVALVA